MENSMKKDRTLLFPFQGEGMGEGAKDFFSSCSSLYSATGQSFFQSSSSKEERAGILYITQC